MRLKQVCALGRFSVGVSTTWIVNKRGPAAPVEPVGDTIYMTTTFQKGVLLEYCLLDYDST